MSNRSLSELMDDLTPLERYIYGYLLMWALTQLLILALWLIYKCWRALAKVEYAKLHVIAKAGSTMVTIMALKVECSPLSLIQTFDQPVNIVRISGTTQTPMLHLNWHGRELRDAEIAGLVYPKNAIPLSCRQGVLLSWITGIPHVVYTEQVY